MTANELNRYFLKTLEEKYSSHEASNIAAMVFESIAGITRMSLIKDPQQIIPEEVSNKVLDHLSLLQKDMPVQYVLGEAWFYGMKLAVSGGVLIPRPETEELVAEAIGFLKGKKNTRILDIGTGSGCIAIAIKKNVPAVDVTAIDVSEAALEIARSNARFQDTIIEFNCSDFLEEQNWLSMEGFDMIISNPPYIPLDELEKMDRNVIAYEPHTALFVESARPLIFYEKIASFGRKHLQPEGKIFMETHEDLASEVLKLFQQNGFVAQIKKDMFGKERMVIATHYL